MALYSASAENRATTHWRLEFHDMGESPRRMQKPLVGRRVDGQPVQSLSQYTVR